MNVDDRTQIMTERPTCEEPKAWVLKGRFIMEKILGEGGMGIVYKAKDLVMVEARDPNPYVAIKLLGDAFKTHPDAFVSLQRESRKTQKIAHDNIVRVSDFDRDGEIVYMTMELLEGKSLDKLINQYKATGLPLDDTNKILQGVCAALIHAHSKNTIHLDLKPGNIFITQNNTAKVLDFGIARAVSTAQASAISSPENHTIFDPISLGAMTPPYASLEMFEGLNPDRRDDIYALGCIAYELHTGHHPFYKKNATDALDQKLKPNKIKHLKNTNGKQSSVHWHFIVVSALQRLRNFGISTMATKKTPKLNSYIGAHWVCWLFQAVSRTTIGQTRTPLLQNPSSYG